MSDITINTNKLMAMITGAVFAAGAVGAGVGAAVGIRAAAATATASIDSGAAERAALQKDRDAFRQEVRDTLASMKGAASPGLTVGDLRLAILQAEAAKNFMPPEARSQAASPAQMDAARKWREQLFNTMK